MSEERIDNKQADGDDEPVKGTQPSSNPGEPNGPGEISLPKMGDFSVRWVVIGALVLIAGITLGDKVLWKSIVNAPREGSASSAPDHEAIRAAAAKASDDMSDEEKHALRSAVAGDRILVASLALMLIVLPFGVGIVVGAGTKSLLNAAVAVAVGAAVALGMSVTDERAIIVLAIATPLYFGFGALAGLIGKRLAARRAAA
jgi:hypothetical protein